MPPHTAPSCSSNLPMTLEQEVASRYNLVPGTIVKIKAFAGTGKTTTLVELARNAIVANPAIRILYACFNKALRRDGERRFSSMPQVKCRTFNSIAFRAVVFQNPSAFKKFKLARMLNYRHIMDLLHWEMDINDDSARWYIEHGLPFPHSNMAKAQRVLKSLNMFLASADDEPTWRHIYNPPGGEGKEDIDDAELLTGLTTAWNRVRDMTDLNAPLPHNAYLKLASMKSPSVELKYDMILLDEAQDLSDVDWRLFSTQLTSRFRPQIVLVGDPHQSIYGFRGAKDVWETLEARQTFTLTQSFRFQDSIANVANAILNCKGEEEKLRGSANMTDFVLTKRRPLKEQLPEGKLTMIFRTNKAIIDAVLTEALSDNPRRYYISTGNPGHLLRDGFSLFCGDERPKPHSALQGYDTWDQLREEVQEVTGEAVHALAAIVYSMESTFQAAMESEESQEALLHNLTRVEELHCRFPEKAELTLLTAHESRGSEYDRVAIADDFLAVFSEPQSDVESWKQEMNCLYVAITRAKRELIVNEQLSVLLEQQEEAEKLNAATQLQSHSDIRRFYSSDRPPLFPVSRPYLSHHRRPSALPSSTPLPLRVPPRALPTPLSLPLGLRPSSLLRPASLLRFV
ncbi:P-loop containing nucleoside triphosphate hydrolase protein [Atractiella rhizophila]|nr:P-loop containing nucleoside triphosphate hydrolase protein [Atractiella rhizophila]